MTSSSPHSRLMLAFYLLTALLCGALIMVIEVLGSRVIGPFFGVSLFVWTSLISVAMIALAAGYSLGGLLSDRLSHPRYLYMLIMLAGFLTLLVPSIKGPVLMACVPMGLRTGSFVSTLILFGPALFLLGCVSPFLVKILAAELRNLGRVVGGLYAVSTIGSVVGTVLTGFVLVAYLGVDQIYALAGALLIALGASYFAFFQRRWYVLLLLAMPLVLWPSEQAVSKVLSDGTHVELIHRQDTHYGNIKVVEYSYQQKRIREMMIDGLIQGGVDYNTGLSVYSYPYLLQYLPRAIHQQGRNALVIGVGAGVIPRWYQSQGVSVDVVDIDPAVVDVARDYFNYQSNGSTHIADARYFLTQPGVKYDYVILDAFNGDITPGHLISIQALRLIRHRLSSNGVLGLNLIGSLKEHTLITASVVHTLKQVFDQVHVVPVDIGSNSSGISNLAIVAYQGSRKALLPLTPNAHSIYPAAYQEVANSLRQEFTFPADTPVMTLTDNFNPVDFYDVWLREQVRAGIMSYSDWDILLN